MRSMIMKSIVLMDSVLHSLTEVLVYALYRNASALLNKQYIPGQTNSAGTPGIRPCSVHCLTTDQPAQSCSRPVVVPLCLCGPGTRVSITEPGACALTTCSQLMHPIVIFIPQT